MRTWAYWDFELKDLYNVSLGQVWEYDFSPPANMFCRPSSSSSSERLKSLNDANLFGGGARTG